MSAGADFDEFFRAEHQHLVAIAIGVTGVPEAARDLVQDTMTKAYREWDQVSQLERPGAWARRVTINAAIDWQRRQRREQVAVQRLESRPVGDMPATEGARFWAAVRALPERQRAVVALYYLEDRSIAQVAEIMQMPDGTVKSTLGKARTALAQTLGLGRVSSNHENEEQ